MVVPDLGQYSDLNELTVSMWVKFEAVRHWDASENGGNALFMKTQPVGANAVVQFSIYTEYDHNALRFDTRFVNGTQINLRFEPFSESLDQRHGTIWHADLTTESNLLGRCRTGRVQTLTLRCQFCDTSYDVMTSTTFGNPIVGRAVWMIWGMVTRAVHGRNPGVVFMAAAELMGCTNMTACNFNSEANSDDGSWSCL